eukprot:scaffold56824_cov50-Phaeocystis_antarctica.AAC.2
MCGRARLVPVAVARHAELLEHEGLAQLRRVLRVVAHVLLGEAQRVREGLCAAARVVPVPVLRPHVRGHVVDGGVAVVAHDVGADVGLGEGRAPLGARRDEVVRVERLDQHGALVEPTPVPRHRLHRAWLVGELPRHDGGVVAVRHARERVGALHDVPHVLLEHVDAARLVEELRGVALELVPCVFPRNHVRNGLAGHPRHVLRETARPRPHVAQHQHRRHVALRHLRQQKV